MKRIVVMVSGGGSNLQTILDGCARGEIEGRVELVIATNRTAHALVRAREAGVDARAIARADYGGDQAACDRARHQALKAANPDLIVLAGYLGILLPETVRLFENRIINVHPALIPAFCGRGMYGIHVHRAALECGVKVSGATVHFVNEGVDTGPIILQQAVPVLQGDSAEDLAGRVLAAEHALLPRAVQLFCAGKLAVDGRRVSIV